MIYTTSSAIFMSCSKIVGLWKQSIIQFDHQNSFIKLYLILPQRAPNQGRVLIILYSPSEFPCNLHFHCYISPLFFHTSDQHKKLDIHKHPEKKQIFKQYLVKVQSAAAL